MAQPDGSFLLSENLVVLAGASLDMTSSTPPGVKMLSSPAAYVSIVTLGGQLTLKGSADAVAAFASYDPTTASPDTAPADGRGGHYPVLNITCGTGHVGSEELWPVVERAQS